MGRKRCVLVLLVAGCLVAVVLVPSGANAFPAVGPCGTNGVFSSNNGTASCGYTTNPPDTFTVPSEVTSVAVTAVGGMGGGGYLGGAGGYGASVAATLSVTPAAQLAVVVAGNGGSGGNASAGSASAGGGGAGGCGPRCGGGGGGASSVSSSGTTLVIAGGGGGGGGGGNQSGQGGGAGTAGENGGTGCLGGGTSVSNGGGLGGSAPYASCYASATAADNGPGGNGSAGHGGSGGNSSNAGSCAGGGGGGGGYGGGGGGQASGQCAAAGGGGGSSYAIDQGATIGTDIAGTPLVKISWTLPSPTLTTAAFDNSTSAEWSGSEVAGAESYDTSSFDQSSLVAGDPTGSVTYTLYFSDDCTGSPSSTDQETVGANAKVPNSAATAELVAGDFSWQASYSGDSSYRSVTSPCEPFTVNKANPTVDTTVYDSSTNSLWNNAEVWGAKAYDTATVNGVSGVTATGTVGYSFFGNDSCQGTAVSTDQEGLSSGSVPNSAPTGGLTTGSYSYQASYSGDDNYKPASGSCESFSVSEAMAPFNDGHPVISGTAQDGRTLTTTHGAWSSPEPLTYSYQWSVCSPGARICQNIAGATHQTLKLTPADVGQEIDVSVTARDADGLTASSGASRVGPVAKPKSPKSTSLPLITGKTQVGHVLTASHGGWSSPDKLTYKYQWSLCSRPSGSTCSKLAGATHRSIVLTKSDAGKRLRVTVSASDQEGQTGRASSHFTGPVTR